MSQTTCYESVHHSFSTGCCYANRTRNGIADEQLAIKEAERGRKRAAEEDGFRSRPRKRSRSASSYSSTSVSTISTNNSRPASPKRSKLDGSRAYTLSQPQSLARSSHTKSLRKRRRDSSSSDRSYSTTDSSYDRRRPKEKENDRNTRRRRSSVSPEYRGRERDQDDRRSYRSVRSRSNSMDRSKVARHRTSMTPDTRNNHDRSNGRPQERPPLRTSGRRYTNDDDRYGSSYRDEGHDNGNETPAKHPPPRKERSLSPFSKRLALTQAMNMGR